MAGVVQTNYSGLETDSWIIGEYLGKNKYSMTCKKCGYSREIVGYFIGKNKIPKCSECDKVNKEDLTGKMVGYWELLKKTANGRQAKWLCRCHCDGCNGTEREVLEQSLKLGKSLSCGATTNKKFYNLTGRKFHDWTVISYNKEKMKWLCECSCEKHTRQYLTGYQLKEGLSKSCGHNTTGFKDLTGMKFGEWEVLRRNNIELFSGSTSWVCQCSCEDKTIDILSGYTLRNGVTKSCGCKTNDLRIATCLAKYGVEHSGQIGTKRTTEQLEIVKSRDNIINEIKKLNIGKVTIAKLADIIGVSTRYAMLVAYKYKLYDYVLVKRDENDGLKAYGESLQMLYNCKDVRNIHVGVGTAFDMYFKNKHIAVDFNTNYRHCELNVEQNYHKDRTVECSNKGIQLISIFEYEWGNALKQQKIKKLLDRKLRTEVIRKINVAECSLKYIESAEAREFEDKYNILDNLNSEVKVGMTDKDGKLICIMTFGTPRYDKSYKYEMLRLTVIDDIDVIGGAEKLFNKFIKDFNPESIVAYCDIAKFTGDVYTRLGFTNLGLTKPNYKWVDCETNEVLSRYETTKKLLVEKGLGTEEQTEVEIMHNLGFVRIYDSGNMKFEWLKK